MSKVFKRKEKKLWPFNKKALRVPADPALNWRVLDTSDLEDLYALFDTIESYDDPPYRTGQEEIKVLFNPQHRARSVGGFDQAGKLQAFAHVRIQTEDTSRAICSGGVAPSWRKKGCGSFIVEWQESNARELLAQEGAAKQVIVCHVEPHMLDYQNILADYGFTWTQSFYEMRRPVSQPLPQVKLPAFVAIEPWREELDDAARQLANEVIFAQAKERPLSPSQWGDRQKHRYLPACALAVDRRGDRPKVVGLLVCSFYPQDWKTLGWEEGYIDLMVISPEHNNETIAAGLLGQCLEALAAKEVPKVAVGVEVETSHQLLLLYEALGFQTTNLSKVMSMQLD